jgi:hypothetical protein
MPQVVSSSRDKYSIPTFWGGEVRLIPVPTLPLYNLSGTINTVTSDVIQSQDTVFVMLTPYNLGERK